MLERTPDSPLHGPYLVHNPVGNAALHASDAALRLVTRHHATHPESYTRPRRLLLCNIAHLGDVVLATSILAPLRRAYPELELGMLVSSGATVVVHDHPGIDRVHTYDHWKNDRTGRPIPSRLRDHARSFSGAAREILRARYDVAVDLNFHYPNAIPVLWAAGVPLRVGYPTGGLGDLLTHRVPWSPGAGHITDYHLALLAQLPGFSGTTEPLLPSLPDTPPPPLAPAYVVIHPGAGAPTKEWPTERWYELAGELASRGRTLVLTGAGERESSLNAGLAASVAGVEDLTGKLSWSGFVATLRGADAVVTVDTAAGHVASAWGVPAVVMMNGVHPPALWRPLGDRVRSLSRPVPCSPCHLGRGCEGMECIRELSVASVLQALERVEAP